jgi:hypothetical protein
LELELPYGAYSFTLKRGTVDLASAKQRAAPTWKKASLK